MSPQPKNIRLRITTLAMIVLCVGAILLVKTIITISPLASTEGTVESIGKIAYGGEGFPATISFRDQRGDIYHFQVPTRPRLFGSLGVGDHVGVLYDPQEPMRSARLNQPLRIWLWPGICALVGIALLAVRGKLDR